MWSSQACSCKMWVKMISGTTKYAWIKKSDLTNYVDQYQQGSSWVGFCLLWQEKAMWPGLSCWGSGLWPGNRPYHSIPLFTRLARFRLQWWLCLLRHVSRDSHRFFKAMVELMQNAFSTGHGIWRAGVQSSLCPLFWGIPLSHCNCILSRDSVVSVNCDNICKVVKKKKHKITTNISKMPKEYFLILWLLTNYSRIKSKTLKRKDIVAGAVAQW